MEVELGRLQEYRIEVLESQKMKVMVTAGLAEVKGQELLNDKWHVFQDVKTTIFTFTGAKLRIDGSCDLQYTASSSCFPHIFNYFDTNKDSTKTVLVLGRGRTTFCTTVANYFVRMHKEVDFVELDPSKGNVFPGALSLLHIDCLVDCMERFRLKNPVSLFYGSLAVENDELFEAQTEALAKEIESRGRECFRMVLCPDLAVEELNSLSKRFKASEAVVVGDERFFHRTELFIPKIFIENSGYIQENMVAKSIHRYFNGVGHEYTPCSFIVKHDWEIVRIGELYTAPESALPLGATRKVGKTDVCRTDPVENAVLAISEAEEDSQVATSPVMGFIVCLDDKRFRVLCTQPKLPKMRYLVQGNIKYIDF